MRLEDHLFSARAEGTKISACILLLSGEMVSERKWGLDDCSFYFC